MKSAHLLATSAFLAASLTVFAQAKTNLGADLNLDRKAVRTEVKQAVEEKDGIEVPPELRTRRADARMEKLRLLIAQGIKEKQLTNGEATAAAHQLGRIEREEETYKHNKRVGPRERNDLRKDINKLHEYLWEKTHNGNKPTEVLDK